MDYTNLYNFQSSAGIIVPSDEEVIANTQTKFQEIFGTDIDLSPETPVGRLVEAFAVMIKTALGVTAQSANQFNIKEATGVYLDGIGQLYNLTRIAGTKSRISIKCYFSDNPAGTNTIPAGALITANTSGASFTIDGPIENNGTQIDPETNKYFAVGTATATTTGPIVVPNGSVNNIQTAVTGWVGVTNYGTSYVGSDIESDEAFRKRIIESRPTGVGFYTHLMSTLRRVEGVYSSCVVENNTGSSQKKKGVLIPPHSIFVCLDFVETEELISQVSTVISEGKPVGTGMVASGVPKASLITRTINFGTQDGASQVISFYRCAKTAIEVDITYSEGEYSGINIEDDIKKVVIEYIANVGVGGVVSAAMITKELITRLSIGIGATYVRKEGSDTPFDTSVAMDGYESAYSRTDIISTREIS